MLGGRSSLLNCGPRAGRGLEKDAADARGFFLGETALFLGIDGGRRHDGRRNRPAPVLRVEDRTAEVARQRRP